MFQTLMMMAAALPPNPGREAAPPGIEARALPVGAAAPSFTLPDSAGGQWTRRGTAVLVFYRGHW